MSRYLRPDDVTQISHLLSADRLDTFRNLTVSKSTEDAIELHQVTMSLGVSLLAVTGLIEVSLRNAVCYVMNNEFGGQAWLRTPPPSSFKWSGLENSSIKKAEIQAQRAAYAKMTGQDKNQLDEKAYPDGEQDNSNHRDLAKKRQSTINVPDSQVISQLTIYFWKRLFSSQYEKSLWKRALKNVFPNKKLSRADVAEHLEVIYEIRNRLAHHEPVYGRRLEKILASIDFVALNLGSRVPDPENAFAKLIMPQRDHLHGQVAIFKSTFVRLTQSLT